MNHVGQVDRSAGNARNELHRRMTSAVSSVQEAVMSAIEKEEQSRVEIGIDVARMAHQVTSVDAHVTSVVQPRLNDLEKQLGDLAESGFGFGGSARPFTRLMSYSDAKALSDYWNERLDLEIAPKHIQYMARKLLVIEAIGAGRIATSVGDAMIRAFATRSINRAEVQVLEIGTLFGLGALFVGEAARPFFDHVELTLIDPLDGYYGGLQVDPPTGLTVTRSVLESNVDRLAWPRDDVRILQGYSTEDEILSQASDREYDVLILDGDHSYDGIRLDFERYAHLVRQGGLLVVDDYGTPDWPDVGRYADDVIRFDPRFDFVGSGLRTAVFRRAGRADPSTPTP
jgi:predicted O-methyltransferase YrrM